MEVIQIDMKEFEPDRMIENKTILIIGPQYSGKTTLNRDLLYYINTPFALLVDPTENLKMNYGQILPKQCKLSEIDNDILGKLCNRQLTLSDFNKKYRRNLASQACLILDNCIADLVELKWERNKTFKWLFRTGKDADISMIITSPYPPKMPAHYLATIDYVFMLHDTNKKHKKKLFDDFGGMFSSLEEFTSVFNECTRNFGCMVIDRTKVSDQLNEQVFWYKAKTQRRKFHMGSKQLWKMCLNGSTTLEDMLGEPLRMFEKN